MNYETATDFELNAKLAELDLPCDYELKEGKVLLVNTNTYLGAHGEPYEVVEAYGEFNPCNNWGDIMPIAMELGVSIIKIKGYEALCAASIDELHDIDDDIFVARSKINISDESPQRAIVICCLEILNCKEGK